MSSFHLRLIKQGATRFQHFRPRAALVLAVFALGFAVLLGRAFTLQVVRHDFLTDVAQRQSQRILRVQGQRGAILDRHGGLLASSVLMDSIYARPPQVQEPAKTAFRLARVLGLSADAIGEDLSSDKPFVWLKRQVTPSESQAVRDLNLPGVRFTQEYRRVYPDMALGGALLGFTGVDTQGLEGLEYAYNSYLRGKEGWQVIDQDALGRTLFNGEPGQPSWGGTVELTIHPGIQHIVERELEDALTRYQAPSALAIVMHSRTGELLAMGHAPGFNPNRFGEFDKATFFNRAVTSGYEPGSTFKLFTLASAFEEHLIEPDTAFYCEKGSWEHYDSVITDTEPHEWLTPETTLVNSSNICAAKIGILMPPEVFAEYVQDFGFGRRLGLFQTSDGRRLAGEATGYMLPPANWTPVDHAAISFGHGILVSPLQLVTAVNTFANRGRLLPPVLVRAVRDPHGRLLESGGSTPPRQVVSPETADIVRRFMKGVVESGEGTGSQARVPGFTVAGKTGTTEKFDIAAQGYSKTRHIVSFVGFLPAENPELTILVVVDQPKLGRYGGSVAAPIFSRIAGQTLPLLGVWPEAPASRRLDLAKADGRGRN